MENYVNCTQFCLKDSESVFRFGKPSDVMQIMRMNFGNCAEVVREGKKVIILVEEQRFETPTICFLMPCSVLFTYLLSTRKKK